MGNLRRSVAGSLLILLLAGLAGSITNHFTRSLSPTSASEPDGIQRVDLREAIALHNEGILFVDARSEEVYAEGHIPGAYLFDYFQFNQYVPAFVEKFPKSMKMVVYCEGITGSQNEDTCHTSKLLAEQLSQLGYTDVHLFEGGYSFWSKEFQTKAPDQKVDREVRTGPSLLNTAFNFAVLLFGILAVAFRRRRIVTIFAQIALGCIFVYAGSTKILHAKEMAVILTSYNILPDPLVNISAMTIPWVECLAGAFLISGLLPTSAALVISGMNLFFIPALSYRALQIADTLQQSFFQVNFDCGCGLGENFAWILIVRDAGFLLMGIVLLLGHAPWNLSDLFRRKAPN